MSVFSTSEIIPKTNFSDGQENPFNQNGSQSQLYCTTNHIKRFIDSNFDLASFQAALSDLCSLPKVEIAKVFKSCSSKI